MSDPTSAPPSTPPRVKKPVCYVAMPYRAGTLNQVWRNIQAAREQSLQLWRCGLVVLCPHMNTALMDGWETDDVWLDGAIELLLRCDAIFMGPRYESSQGSRAEFELARANGLKIFAYNDESIEFRIRQWVSEFHMQQRGLTRS